MTDPQYTKRFKSWLKKRPNDLRPLIAAFPPGKYRVKDGAPYAISCPGTVVQSHSYGKTQVTVEAPTGVTFQDKDGNLTKQTKPSQKWVKCVNCIVLAAEKLPEALERENHMAVQNVESRIMQEKFANAQDEITKRLIEEIPKETTAAEEKILADLDALKETRELTPEEEKSYKEAWDGLKKKEKEQLDKLDTGVREELKTMQSKLVEESQVVIKKQETQDEIKALQEKFHKDNVVVAIEPEHLELIEISPEIIEKA